MSTSPMSAVSKYQAAAWSPPASSAASTRASAAGAGSSSMRQLLGASAGMGAVDFVSLSERAIERINASRESLRAPDTGAEAAVAALLPTASQRVVAQTQLSERTSTDAQSERRSYSSALTRPTSSTTVTAGATPASLPPASSAPDANADGSTPATSTTARTAPPPPTPDPEPAPAAPAAAPPPEPAPPPPAGGSTSGSGGTPGNSGSSSSGSGGLLDGLFGRR